MTDSLNTVDQEAFDSSEAIVIELLRSAYPNLDLRRGTVLRDLLVRPASAFYALEASRYDQAKITQSLSLMVENPDVVTSDDVNRILANFSINQKIGSKAFGSIRVLVAFERTYSFNENTFLVSIDGLTYNVDGAYNIVPESQIADASDIPLKVNPSGEGYYFLLPIVATNPGVIYELAAGSSLSFTAGVDGFIASEVYADLTGGIDPESISDVITRLPAAISHRSFESRKSIEAILSDSSKNNFTDKLVAISAQGYGDRVQLRDKHNPFGVAMGGKVDIFVRTFQQPAFITLEKIGERISPNNYKIKIDAIDAPGFYAVRAVTDAESDVAPELEFGDLPVLGSYDVSDVRGYTGIKETFHDIALDNATIESAFTVFQTGELLVNDVNAADKEFKNFKVQLYYPPELANIQSFVDSPDIRNLKADYLVRSALVCLVRFKVSVVKKSSVTNLDTEAMKTALADYINSRSFVSSLTASELVSILHDFDITRVNMDLDPSNGFELTGVIRDAAGNVHRLKGQTLDLKRIENPKNLCTPETIVFAVDPDDIHINVLSS